MKKQLKKKIFQVDFAIHELSLYLDTHPTSKKTMELLREYRKLRSQLINEYERQFGDYIVTTDDVSATGCWEWLENPWPWEINFMED